MNKKNSVKERNKILPVQESGEKKAPTAFESRFLRSDLGELWSQIPFESLSASIITQMVAAGVHVPSWGWLSISGGIAVHVLKSYYNGLSDAKLIEGLNLNSSWQRFCFLELQDGEEIKDRDLLRRWRKLLGTYLDGDAWNRIQLQSWFAEIEHAHIRQTDATVYEVKMGYPTDVKLLWQACEWVYKRLEECNQALRIGLYKKYRKYEEQALKQQIYSKKRRKTAKMTRKRIETLLYWLEKGVNLLTETLAAYSTSLTLIPRAARRFEIIRQLLEQQKSHFQDPKIAIPHRIVSLQQPHIRPIVRGKEQKSVEFGPKVSMLRIGQINLVERIDFNNFNECTSFERICTLYDDLTGACKQVAGDKIYATNANRSFASQNEITTNFVQKGRCPQQKEAQIQLQETKKALNTLRATHMEGSFGNEKEHFGVRKINARTPETQKALFFCALITANALTLIHKRQKGEDSTPKQSQPLIRAA